VSPRDRSPTCPEVGFRKVDGLIPVESWTTRNVWFAALSQAKNEADRLQTDGARFSSNSGITLAFLLTHEWESAQTGIHCFCVVGVMRKPRSALILFVLLVLSLSLAVPVEDALETTYDESEAQPYEAIPLFSILLLAADRTTQAVLTRVRPHLGVPSRLGLTCFADKASHRSAKAPVALALLCTLLC